MSVVAEVKGSKLVAYEGVEGYPLEMLSNGHVSAKKMFADAHHNNNVRTWILRGLSLVLTFVGLRMAVNFIDVIANAVPLFGGLLGGLVGIALNITVFFVSLALVLTVVGVCWLWYRPIMASALLLGAGVAAWFAWQNRSKKGPNSGTGSRSPPPYHNAGGGLGRRSGADHMD